MGVEMTINALKQFNKDRALELVEAIALSAFARDLENEYEALEIEVPQWLTDQCEALRRVIEEQNRANEMEELRTLERQIESLTPAQEKRKNLEKQLATKQRKLGLVPAKAGGK